ncbi:hypothetical protein BP5796_11629 [Coleophoma crateriformis]|uniref:Uncharacterized protein n=1 Tax=Coleophoma crateriformis TaxID=565419 RepID=A0A3D8QDV4_9HELO|nr:hypothetical protein BP5796_11629 [Coleophoma crateriformis]
MPGSTFLEEQIAQMNHLNRLLGKLDKEMLSLSREQVRQKTDIKLEADKTEFRRVREDVVKALRAIKSNTFQNLAQNSTDILQHVEGIGAALVSATTNLNQAWSKYCEDERAAQQHMAYTRRLSIRKLRQQYWERKCRHIDGEDAAQDQDTNERGLQGLPLERESQKAYNTTNLTPTLSAVNINEINSIQDPADLTESPRSIEILSEIDHEISRLEADQDAVSGKLKAEQVAHARAASQIIDLQGKISLLEQTLTMTYQALQQLRDEKGPTKPGQCMRPVQSDGDLYITPSLRREGSLPNIKDQQFLEKEGYVIVGPELNELKITAEELRKEKEEHAATVSQLVDLQEQVQLLSASADPGDFMKCLKKLKPSKSRTQLNVQYQLDQATTALNTEKTKHSATTEKLKALKKKMQLQEPLVEVGQLVRRRFLEKSKSALVDGGVVEIGSKVNVKAIDDGVDAVLDLELTIPQAFLGNAHADAALFALGYLDHADSKALFEELYGCPIINPPTRALRFPKLTELFNMRATMGFCSSFTAHTLSEAQDARFKTLERECIAFLGEIRRQGNGKDEELSLTAFESHPGVEARLQEMRAIVGHILALEKQRSHDRF